jgi:predicted alpha/beta-hydrolase family hydrolase
MKSNMIKAYGAGCRNLIILAHGAGAPMDSSFMEELAEALEAQQIACVRFEFPYMQKRREDGKKRPPDRQPVLLEHFRTVLEQVRAEVGPDCRVLIGGKSMGGRMASLLASEDSGGIDGVVCYGYPFHAPGKTDKWRVDHLPEVQCPLMVIQGTRDPFGKRQEVQERGAIAGLSRLVWLEGGNHDFQPLKKQPETQRQLIKSAAQATRRFVDECIVGA